MIHFFPIHWQRTNDASLMLEIESYACLFVWLFACLLLGSLVNFLQQHLKNVSRHRGDLIQLGLNLSITRFFILFKDFGQFQVAIQLLDGRYFVLVPLSIIVL